MLYVFQVDVGRMLNFDMTVALSSVESLKDTIERLHNIPAANIVLLVSGGEMLTHSTQVSYYSAGTDTNPIYMFLTGDVRLPPSLLPSVDADFDLREQVERCLELPAVYETVVRRAQLAGRIYELAREEERLCERLVHDQHLQQQGWSAMVANVEDLTEEFRQRYKNFCEVFDKHLEKRSIYLELLTNFADDLRKLSRIPILPGLMPLAEADFHGFDDYLDNDDVFSRSQNQQESVLMAGAAEMTEKADAEEEGAIGGVDTNENDKSSTSPNKKLKMGTESTDLGHGKSHVSQTSTNSNAVRRLNLLQWITSKENHDTLQIMSDECVQGLGTFNEEIYKKLKDEIHQVFISAEQSDVLEIKGLSERLCKLEEFIYKIKNMVKDQKELSTAFHQNQNRAINLRDASILPDLCASHQSQLKVMLQNHFKIRDYRRCISKAKDELSMHLQARLHRIDVVENAMSEADNRLLFHHRCLRRVERHIHIIEQIHQAPHMYVAAVTEVMRRKIFSTEFRLWASKLAEDFESIHSEEMKRRNQFNANFEGHFLNILFPGMNDMPPAFANENPLIFDARLPNITRSDIDMLTSYLPEMASQIQLPDMEPVIYFFVSRSGTHQRERLEDLIKRKKANETDTAKYQQPLGDTDEGTAMANSIKFPQLQRLNELRQQGKCEVNFEESETDTETEFEKVPASAQSIATSTSDIQLEVVTKSTATEQLLVQSAETLTEESEETMRSEIDHMRIMLGNMSKLALDCIQLARSDLTNFRQETETHRDDMLWTLQSFNNKWHMLRMQYIARDEMLQADEEKRLQELKQLRETISNREMELQEMQERTYEMEAVKMKCATMEIQLEELRDQLSKQDLEKDKAVAEIREKLIHEHKTEIESLRQRFKLMTSMEHTPSESSSLEKIERSITVSPEHIERAYHETILAQQKAELEAEKEKAIAAAIELERSVPVMANAGILKDMLEEKERQLDQLREKDLMLTKENFQLKTRLDALTNEEGNSWLKEKIEYLNRDKCRLEEELNVEKSRRLEMETSFAALRGSTYDQTALSRSKSSTTSQKFIVLKSCSKGDLVFVVWSVRHGQFIVVQDSPSLYFVHGDSLPCLNLRLPQSGEATPTIPMPYYAVGRVIEKECCQARKDENRYRVSRGSKFYRIKLAPFRQTTRQERLDSFSCSISRSLSHYEGHSEAAASTTVAPVNLAIASSTGMGAASLIAAGSTSIADQDVVDMPSSTVVTTATTVTTATQLASSGSATSSLKYKERALSINSINEEDDEPVSILSDRYRYTSVGEEDETATAVITASTSKQISEEEQPVTTTQPHSVITEQPTASKLIMDLILASTALSVTTTTNTTTFTSTTNTINTDNLSSCSDEEDLQPLIQQSETFPIRNLGTASTERTDQDLPSILNSTATNTSEDSDEYRSLEPKYESDFPILE
uniref:RB1-inducible coiled-coil protein 1 n=1 Tax=Glossina brevipalpis TaxID=37001 RepID=A0A1A9WH20_9MUSC